MSKRIAYFSTALISCIPIESIGWLIDLSYNQKHAKALVVTEVEVEAYRRKTGRI